MKRKGILFWIIAGGVLVTLLNAPAPLNRVLEQGSRDLLAPVQGLINSWQMRFRDAGEAIRGWGGLPEQNQELQEEVMRLRRELAEFDEIRGENAELRRELGFQQRSERNLIAGSVIARDISGWWQTVRIQHGGSPLIQPDRAVVTTEGLVGRVTGVSGRTADVLLISDPGCRVSVQIGGPEGPFAVLSGQGLNWRGRVVCQLQFINKNQRVNRGDRVYTSGLGGVFPRGILVGTIESVTLDDQQLHQSAEVKPVVDLAHLNVVFVVAESEATL